MILGAMNHPARDVLGEIRQFAEMGLNYIDLTLEPPAAAAEKVNVKEIVKLLRDTGMGIVGHTAAYLPFGSPFEALRRGAVDELRRCLETFAELGSPTMSVHPDFHAPFHTRSFSVRRNLESLAELMETAHRFGIALLVENLPGQFNSPAQLTELLEPLPSLGLLLDFGHANLLVEENAADAILKAHRNRLRHVHLHDNKGGLADLHLPLGTGTLEIARCVHALKAIDYDGTITLEVFSSDPHYLSHSRDLVRQFWEEKQDNQRSF